MMKSFSSDETLQAGNVEKHAAPDNRLDRVDR